MQYLSSSSSVRLYSPNQVALGSFICMQFGVAYFLGSNLISVGNYSAFWKMIALIVFSFVVTLLYGVKYASDASAYNFTYTTYLIYPLIARHVSKVYCNQGAVESKQFNYNSNWRTLAFIILCFLGQQVIAICAGMWVYYFFWLPN
ncbi:MAG: hypothetical protein ACRC7J_17230 [Vibrio ordalii]|uniref:hypothetical protein n=1 Tax=Vibrio ordalii TaxID=28174 RepID=UPI003F418D85